MKDSNELESRNQDSFFEYCYKNAGRGEGSKWKNNKLWTSQVYKVMERWSNIKKSKIISIVPIYLPTLNKAGLDRYLFTIIK